SMASFGQRDSASSSGHSQSSGLGGNTCPGNCWATTLADLDFTFDANGRLIDNKTGQVFEFNYIRDPSKADSMRRYERLGEVITSYIYQLMRDDHGMQELPVSALGDPQTFPFAPSPAAAASAAQRPGTGCCLYLSPPCQDDADYLLVIIQGGGYRGQPIEGHETAERHVETVWRTVVRRAPQRHVFVICHGHGGVAFTHQLQPWEPGDPSQGDDRQLWETRRREFIADLRDRVPGVAFCDSYFCLPMQGIDDPEVIDYFQKRSRNWVSSDQPLDQPIDTGSLTNWGQAVQDTPKVSAGTPAHERIPANAMVSVFRWLFSMCDRKQRLRPETMSSMEQALLAAEKQMQSAASADSDT
uniref:Metallophos domain-containing protein n=1 Tax=Macrostomum lignano TaxID=282301 RepID=A0A1I8HX45_9PLAT